MRCLRRPVERFARATAACAALALALAASPPVLAGPSDGAPSDPGAEVVLRALSLLGVNYRFGGNSPDSGLDCSGLVRHVFQDSLGMLLPRRSEEMSRVGGSIRPSELQPGDLVFFNTLRRAFSHVGIYIGNNQFVHAPSTGGAIRVESLDKDYWTRRFDGARRLLATDPSAVGAPATLVSALAAPRTDGARPSRESLAAAKQPGPRARIAPATPAEKFVVRLRDPEVFTH
jgi:hypothetical protein